MVVIPYSTVFHNSMTVEKKSDFIVYFSLFG